MDNPFPDKTQAATASNMKAGTAVAIGQLIVNVPVLVIIIGFIFLGLFFLAKFQSIILLFVSGLLGFVLAWLWWSLAVPRWRRWALKRGAPPEKLQELAVMTGLVWPKGSIFEKTEFKTKE